MPQWQMKEAEEKHVISRAPLQESRNQNSVSRILSRCDGRMEEAKRRRGRRKGKGVQMEKMLEIGGNNNNNPPSSSSSDRRLSFPTRPGYGQLGTKCIVKANHFVAELSDRNLSQYTVKFSPEINSTRLNKAIMTELVKRHKETELGNRLPVYDGRRMLYTAGLLPFNTKDFIITLADDDEWSGITKERRFTVTIKFSAQADMAQLHNFLAGKQADAPFQALKIFDVVLRELASRRYISVGRFFYSPSIKKPQALGNGLQSWRGFYQSIKPTQMGLSLNIDMSTTAFIEPLPVVEFVAQVLGRDISSRPLSDADRVKVKKALRGVKVEVTHRGNIRRKYRISGLTSQPTRELIFPVDEEKNMKSVIEYFQEMYGYTIQYPHLPCLQVGSQRKVKGLFSNLEKWRIFQKNGELKKWKKEIWKGCLLNFFFQLHSPLHSSNSYTNLERWKSMFSKWRNG